MNPSLIPAADKRPRRSSPRRRWSRRWLFLAPMAAVLWPPLFNRVEPSVFGVPFFYTYLFGACVVAALLTVWVDRGDEKTGAEAREERDDA
jgi:hypothetical protein